MRLQRRAGRRWRWPAGRPGPMDDRIGSSRIDHGLADPLHPPAAPTTGGAPTTAGPVGPEGPDAWLDAEGIPDGLPFLLDPDGRYDVELNRYFQRAQVSVGSKNTQQAIAYDLAHWLNFLWDNRRQTSWREATGEDRAAYQRWRRRDPAGPHVEPSTWDREVITVN